MGSGDAVSRAIARQVLVVHDRVLRELGRCLCDPNLIALAKYAIAKDPPVTESSDPRALAEKVVATLEARPDSMALLEVERLLRVSLAQAWEKGCDCDGDGTNPYDGRHR